MAEVQNQKPVEATTKESFKDLINNSLKDSRLDKGELKSILDRYDAEKNTIKGQTTKSLQEFLKSQGGEIADTLKANFKKPTDGVDGIAGDRTKKALEKLLSKSEAVVVTPIVASTESETAKAPEETPEQKAEREKAAVDKKQKEELDAINAADSKEISELTSMSTEDNDKKWYNIGDTDTQTASKDGISAKLQKHINDVDKTKLKELGAVDKEGKIGINKWQKDKEGNLVFELDGSGFHNPKGEIKKDDLNNKQKVEEAISQAISTEHTSFQESEQTRNEVIGA